MGVTGLAFLASFPIVRVRRYLAFVYSLGRECMLISMPDCELLLRPDSFSIVSSAALYLRALRLERWLFYQHDPYIRAASQVEMSLGLVGVLSAFWQDETWSIGA